MESAIGDYESALASAGTGADVALQVRLGQMHLVAGDTSEAVKMLESASAASSEQYQSDMLLAHYYLRQNKLREALASVEKIETKQPQDPMGPTLRGTVSLASKDEPAARASFEKALRLRPGFTPALVALARIDLRNNNPAAAEKRFQAVVDKEPGNESTTLAYVGFLEGQGAPAEKRLALLRQLVQTEPSAIRGRIALVDTLVRADRGRDAVTVAQEALANDPTNPTLLLAASRAQTAAGNRDQAEAILRQLAELKPQSPIPHALLAELYIKAGDSQRAHDALNRALKIKPDYLQAQLTAAHLYSRTGQSDAALVIARDIKRQRPKAPGGYLLEADLLAKDKRWPEADRVLEEGLSKIRASILAVNRHSLLVRSDQQQTAKSFANEWLAANPKDAVFRNHLAERAMRAKDYREATNQYQAILSVTPASAAVLNNLAWASYKLNDPKAVEYADKAYGLAPRSPTVMDTYGWLLVEQGEVARGIELLRKAVESAPQADGVRLNLAKALIRSGDKNAGRHELELLAKKGSSFSEHGEVQELLRTN
jgi:putative PEP-CTERM system TPR-repeat lipoprotein